MPIKAHRVAGATDHLWGQFLGGMKFLPGYECCSLNL
jgi:hypothetical protein